MLCQNKYFHWLLHFRYDRDFLANIGTVILFAVVGTLFNIFAIGYLLYVLAQYGLMGDFTFSRDGETRDTNNI